MIEISERKSSKIDENIIFMTLIFKNVEIKNLVKYMTGKHLGSVLFQFILFSISFQ